MPIIVMAKLAVDTPGRARGSLFTPLTQSAAADPDGFRDR